MLLAVSCLVLSLTNQSCDRKGSTNGQTERREQNVDANASPGYNVVAAWYEVPSDSLAKRRAGADELTAAHNRLAIGTRVRVTHLANAKSVVVRITDRGITNPKIKLDLCKEAAQELEMVGKGVARVRMQVLQDDRPGTGSTESHTSASAAESAPQPAQ